MSGSDVSTTDSDSSSPAQSVTQDPTIEQIFKHMPGRLNQETARHMDAVLQFVLTGEETKRYHVHISDGECRVAEGLHNAPNVTFTVPAATYVDLVMGRTSGFRAFALGKMKFRGDMNIVIKMPKLFRPLNPAP